MDDVLENDSIMGDFFDRVERSKIIETVKAMHLKEKNEEIEISFIECGLNVSTEKAKEIFRSEILASLQE